MSGLNRWSAWICVGLICGCPGVSILHAQTWVEDTFEDFRDGRLDAAGQNLYVSRDGKIRAIHRFDLNQDGYLDLVFNNNHDTYKFIPASLAKVTPDRKITQSALAVEGSTQAELADLNRDGYDDLIFCPNTSGVQTERRFLTIIWGGADGWPSRRSNGVLPVHGARAIAIADLNQDDWPDIVVLNSETWLPGQAAGRIIRIFWGGPAGFLPSRLHDMGAPKAVDLAAADFDTDGSRDIALLTSEGTIWLLWAKKATESTLRPENSKLTLPSNGFRSLTAADCNGDGQPDLVVSADQGIYIIPGRTPRAWGQVINLPNVSASQISVGDLDGDKRPDLVLANRSPAKTTGKGVREVPERIRVLWGDNEGFAASRSTDIEVQSAAATAIGDVDGDGCADLAVAISQGPHSFAADSRIFFGGCSRKLQPAREGIRTLGAADVVIAAPRGKEPGRLIFCNSTGGTLSEAVPLQLYWGGPGGFDPNRRVQIPFRSGYEASAADLNANGFVDLIVTSSGSPNAEAESTPPGGPTIFWGGKEGFDFEQLRTVLHEPNVGSSNVADLDRDGYLDLALGAYVSTGPELFVIYHGSAKGFDSARRVSMPSKDRPTDAPFGWIGPLTIADFNRDEWLDIVVTSSHSNDVRVFWGSQKGFEANHQTRLLAAGPYSSETADLNTDGYLDLIVGTYNDYRAHHDTGTLIFWGGPKGFHSWDSQWLPGWWVAGMTVADFDADGFLDLFCSHYHGELTRESVPSYLYWGGADGFATRRRTVLIGDSVHDAVAGDFDRDGRLDLAISCHTTDGDHHTQSKVFFNDGHRFINPRVVSLPTHGTHWMWAQDMGHIYDRSWQQVYESSLFDWGQVRSSGHLSYHAEVPKNSELIFGIRSAASPGDMEKQSWREIKSGSFSLKGEDRYLQYRATLKSQSGDLYPILDRVSITLAP